MPPRHQTLPQAKTESAREAQKSFYCELCSKGYTRMNDYEAHLSSYDHSHKQRMKDMKQMVKDPAAIARARKQEQKADGIVSIKIGESASTSTSNSGGGGGGFKKGGFKKTGFVSAPTAATTAPSADTIMEDRDEKVEPASKRARKEDDDIMSAEAVKSELFESDTDDEGYEVYDPRFPTD
ncbi:hypothetical protein QBC37DRAFT_438596 [Rhypophila decipiens]|uniref:C2H2-type domain-containing protein n=1 Tax=Rhypophila decipiens TaxID=261697 RepID=A0AAN6YCI3_9PEZI|nr:hypothetical protein QBC37DRAFT_438596 [Rhypophila decipiens]